MRWVMDYFPYAIYAMAYVFVGGMVGTSIWRYMEPRRGPVTKGTWGEPETDEAPELATFVGGILWPLVIPIIAGILVAQAPSLLKARRARRYSLAHTLPTPLPDSLEEELERLEGGGRGK